MQAEKAARRRRFPGSRPLALSPRTSQRNERNNRQSGLRRAYLRAAAAPEKQGSLIGVSHIEQSSNQAEILEGFKVKVNLSHSLL